MIFNLAAFEIWETVSNVMKLLKECWNFISENPLLVVGVAAPLVLGLIASLISMLRK